MTCIWRICKAEHAAAAFSGEGAVLYPGRWHHAGTPVVYCSESRALAALEQLVNLDRNRLPPNFVCFGVEVPPGVGVARLSIADMPSDWRAQPAPVALRDIGTRWIEAEETAVLCVPSAVVPAEHNFLLNPRHVDFDELVIGAPESFDFDERLLARTRSRSK